VSDAHLATYVCEFGAGVIHNFALVTDATFDFVSQLLAGLNASGYVGQEGDLPPDTGEGAADAASGPQCALDIEQVSGLQESSTLGALSQWADVVHSSQ
jgi:hypothetical protein